MSVIPLIVEGSNRTIVETREEFESAGGLNGKVILIQELDQAQLHSDKDSNASYDLRVGCEYRDHRNVGRKELPPDGVIELLPGTAVIIETEELVHFPKYMFGHIVPKVSLLQKGISNTSSKIDPGYMGKLLITAFNLGKKTIQLRRGERFCTLYVLQVLEHVRPYAKPSKRLVGEAKRQRWQRLRDLLEINNALVMVILIIATFILTIVQIVK